LCPEILGWQGSGENCEDYCWGMKCSCILCHFAGFWRDEYE
jgi:hypothetical protein